MYHEDLAVNFNWQCNPCARKSSNHTETPGLKLTAYAGRRVFSVVLGLVLAFLTSCVRLHTHHSNLEDFFEFNKTDLSQYLLLQKASQHLWVKNRGKTKPFEPISLIPGSFNYHEKKFWDASTCMLKINHQLLVISCLNTHSPFEQSLMFH